MAVIALAILHLLEWVSFFPVFFFFQQVGLQYKDTLIPGFFKDIAFHRILLDSDPYRFFLYLCFPGLFCFLIFGKGVLSREERKK